MKSIKKIFLIIILFNISRIIVSCCDCPADIVRFDFTMIDTKLLRNDSAWTQTLESDTMYAESVAFKTYVSDSSAYYFYYSNYCRQGFSLFPTAMAFSCDCSVPLKPNHYVSDIRIKTLYDINASNKAQSDVTSLFYVPDPESSMPNIVYTEISNQLNGLDSKVYFDDPTEEFQLYLKTAVENDSASFEVSIILSNGTILTDTTNIIHIIPTPQK